METLKQRKILITGASSGIGHATAVALAGPEISLHLVGRDRSRLGAVAEACESKGSPVCVHVADLTSDDINDVLSEFSADSGYPVVIQSAGVGDFAAFADLAWSSIEEQLQVNYLVPARIIHQLLPHILSQGGGQVINVLSMVCENVLPGAAAYAASKAALQMLGKVLAKEYRAQGLRVTNLLPGAVYTPIWAGSSMDSRREEMIPAEDMARVIADLVKSPQTYNVDELLVMPPGGVL